MATIVIPAAYENSCSEMWVDPALLDTADPVLAEEAAIAATWALWSLTGERFHGDQCWVEDYRTISGYCNLQLRRFPVSEVLSVSTVDMCSDDYVGVTGIGTPIDSWCWKGGDEVRVCCAGGGGSWGFTGCGCGNGRTVRVHYSVANNLPPGADRAAAKLASEYIKASNGDEECALPERITSVNRQGASWTILDPQDFLQDGLTGIGSIDQWLSHVGLRSRWIRFTDPLRSVPLVASTQIGCGLSDCFELVRSDV